LAQGVCQIPISSHIELITCLGMAFSIFLLLPSFFVLVHSRNVHDTVASGGLRRSARPPPQLRSEDLKSAVAAVIGESHDVQHEHLEILQKRITPMWRSLPTNEFGRVDRRSLRYAVHRYFMQTYSLSIVGLEPAQVNGQHEEAVLLTEVVPSYVRSELEGKGANVGFTVEDAVVMIATLERLVADTSHELLERSYESVNLKVTDQVGRSTAKRVLEAYMLRWMLGDDTEGIEELEANQSLLEESLEDWQGIAEFVYGQLQGLEFDRRTPVKSSQNSWNEFNSRFSFTDVESVVGSVTMSFGNFWTTECQRVKRLLVDMDYSKSGRVKLSDFYGSAMNGEWRFSESKEYLRQLGALDESSSWQGPRVIITNYMQAASNCIVSAPHYRVCCANECESILGEVEIAVNGPLGSPEQILTVLKNHSSPLDDDVVKLSSSMQDQLEGIAKASTGGMVPLHGRLFAQWLHYAFPRECPFPHKSGETVALSPLEFGEKYAATEEEMNKEATKPQKTNSGSSGSDEEDHWSQWSAEEELLSDTTHLHAPWEPKVSGSMFCVLLLIAGVAAAHRFAGSNKATNVLPTSSFSKSHCC